MEFLISKEKAYRILNGLVFNGYNNETRNHILGYRKNT